MNRKLIDDIKFTTHAFHTRTVLQPEIPNFSGNSYAAVPIDSSIEFVQDLRITFMPILAKNRLPRRSRQFATTYTYLLSSRHFLLLVDNMNRVELRYISRQKNNNQRNESSFIRVIGSRDVISNRWNRIKILNNSAVDAKTLIKTSSHQKGKKFRDSRIDDDDNQMSLNEIELNLPEAIRMTYNNNNSKTLDTLGGSANDQDHPTDYGGELFIAGTPTTTSVSHEYNRHKATDEYVIDDPMDNRLAHNKKLSYDTTVSDEIRESLYGFSGCIKDLSMNQRTYRLKSDLEGDILDAFDISEYNTIKGIPLCNRCNQMNNIGVSMPRRFVRMVYMAGFSFEGLQIHTQS